MTVSSTPSEPTLPASARSTSTAVAESERAPAKTMFTQLTSTIDGRHRGFFAKFGDARQVWALDSDRGQTMYLGEIFLDDQEVSPSSVS